MRDRTINSVFHAAFTLLVISLIYTQVFRFPRYSRLSKNNAIRVIPIDGPRGMIFDRSGTPMVSNRLSFDVLVTYREIRNRAKLVTLLCDTTGISRPGLMKSLEKASLRPYTPVTIVEDIDKEKALILEEAGFDTNGLEVETRSKRHYLYNELGCHVFGYLSEVSEEELEELKDYGYRLKDLVGRSGLEKYYDIYLKGVDGGMQIEVDNKGRQTRVLGLKEPSDGKDIYLTIDLRLQTLCEKLLGGHNGAIIVMDPRNGEVLALTSHPVFDPNIFVKPHSSIQRLKIMKDTKGKPLLNRAISCLYAPGSVFKVVVASGALEAKKITQYTHFLCPGFYIVGKARFDCWKGEGHGSQDVTEGLMNSCNVFFYNTGRAMGVDTIETFTKLFGYGRAAGIDLPDEAQGLVPGRIWKRLYKKDSWYEGETINFAIGQGYLLVTPIQVLQMMTVMANRGNMVQPHIVKRIEANKAAAARLKNVGLKNDVVQKVREGLFKVVNSEGGTGNRAKAEGISIAGKTGTAQNPQGPTHAWFSGFAPYNDPKICLVVFLEHGGKGGSEPSAMAKDIFQEAKRVGYL